MARVCMQENGKRELYAQLLAVHQQLTYKDAQTEPFSEDLQHLSRHGGQPVRVCLWQDQDPRDESQS